VRLELTEAALADLRSIRLYTLQAWGTEQEARYIDMLWEKFMEILHEPGRWRFRKDLFPGCQIAAAGKHVVLFRINDGTLQVVRVLHGAMDFSRHLTGDF